LALIDKPLFSIWKKYHYLVLRLAVSQSLFLVEVSLHDDTAWRQLSRGILSEPFVPKDGSLCCVKLICEDWGVVNAGEYLKFTIFLDCFNC